MSELVTNLDAFIQPVVLDYYFFFIIAVRTNFGCSINSSDLERFFFFFFFLEVASYSALFLSVVITKMTVFRPGEIVKADVNGMIYQVTRKIRFIVSNTHHFIIIIIIIILMTVEECS